MIPKGLGRGWHKHSKDHSDARRFGSERKNKVFFDYTLEDGPGLFQLIKLGESVAESVFIKPKRNRFKLALVSWRTPFYAIFDCNKGIKGKAKTGIAFEIDSAVSKFMPAGPLRMIGHGRDMFDLTLQSGGRIEVDLFDGEESFPYDSVNEASREHSGTAAFVSIDAALLLKALERVAPTGGDLRLSVNNGRLSLMQDVGKARQVNIQSRGVGSESGFLVSGFTGFIKALLATAHGSVKLSITSSVLRFGIVGMNSFGEFKAFMGSPVQVGPEQPGAGPAGASDAFNFTGFRPSSWTESAQPVRKKREKKQKERVLLLPDAAAKAAYDKRMGK